MFLIELTNPTFDIEVNGTLSCTDTLKDWKWQFGCQVHEISWL